MSRRGMKYEIYKDEDYERIYNMKQQGKSFQDAQLLYPRLKYKTYQSINRAYKISPCKIFKKEVKEIVLKQIYQCSDFDEFILEKNKLKKRIRKLIKIQYGPDGKVQIPEGKQGTKMRRSKDELLNETLNTLLRQHQPYVGPIKQDMIQCNDLIQFGNRVEADDQQDQEFRVDIDFEITSIFIDKCLNLNQQSSQNNFQNDEDLTK